MLSAKLLEARSWKNSLEQKDKEFVHKVLEKLPEDSRIVVYLHYWRDLELEDIADALGLRLRDVEYIHEMTLRLLTKVFVQKTKTQKCQSGEVAA